MKTFNINYEQKTIEMTKAFSKAASTYGSAQYKLLMDARRDFPDYELVTKASPKRKRAKDNFKGLTFAYMEKYIQTQTKEPDKKETLLNEFHILRKGDSKNLVLPASYGEIKKWFLCQYPEVKNLQNQCSDIVNRAAAKENETEKENESVA